MDFPSTSFQVINTLTLCLSMAAASSSSSNQQQFSRNKQLWFGTQSTPSSTLKSFEKRRPFAATDGYQQLKAFDCRFLSQNMYVICPKNVF